MALRHQDTASVQREEELGTDQVPAAGAGKTGNEGINKLLLTTPVARPGSWFL